MAVTYKLPPIPPGLKDVVPYKPGKPIEELQRELGIKGAIKMASNENPLGPSPRAQAAVRDCLANLHRYPDGAGFELRSALAARYGLELDQVLLANGSNEVIELLCHIFISPGDQAVAAQYPFGMYPKLVQAAGGSLKEVPLRQFRLDLDGLLAAIDQKTRLLFVNNPHNPAGTAISAAELGGFLDKVPPGVLVALDEAYIDFAIDPQVARGPDFLAGPAPLLVMRTFSKSYGLAGLRIAYALAPAELIGYLDRARQPFNTSIPAQVGALAALGDEDFLTRSLELVANGREQLYQGFDQLGLSYVPSQTNFVLVRIGPRAGQVQQDLLRQGVIVRPMDSYDLPQYLRISVGLPQENQRFLDELGRLLQEG